MTETKRAKPFPEGDPLSKLFAPHHGRAHKLDMNKVTVVGVSGDFEASIGTVFRRLWHAPFGPRTDEIYSVGASAFDEIRELDSGVSTYPVSEPTQRAFVNAGEGVLLLGFARTDLTTRNAYAQMLYDVKSGASTAPMMGFVSGPENTNLLEDVNRYFLIREAEVVRDENAHELLLELYEAMQDGRPLTYDALGLNRSALALARLAMAGFCDLTDDNAKITELGQKFVETVAGG
jgi:hypothetical protein